MAAVIYLTIGVLLVIIGPLARMINERERTPVQQWKRILLEIVLRILCIALYPIILLVMAVDFHRSKSVNKYMEAREGDNSLYFSNSIPGAGIIKCNRCDFSQEVVGLVHGFEPNPWSRAGVQCQNCGKFHTIRRSNENSEDIKCECGGNLDREKALFCPKCRTNDLSYRVKYMT